MHWCNDGIVPRLCAIVAFKKYGDKIYGKRVMSNSLKPTKQTNDFTITTVLNKCTYNNSNRKSKHELKKPNPF